MTTNEIENKVNKKELVNKINKSIVKKRKKYNKIIEHLDKGFDITTGVEINNKQTISRRKIEEREKFYNFLEKAQNKLVEIDSDIFENEKKDNLETLVEIKKEINKPNNISKYKKIAFIAFLNFLTFGSAFYLSKYISNENEINRKTSNIAEDLDETVKNSLYYRVGNLVYNNSEIVEKLDGEDEYADKQYTYIDYAKIANYIKNSDNPDLAAYVLYTNFGRMKTPEFHRIVKRTFKYIEFEGSKNGSEENFDDYIRLSGYEDYNDYYKASRKELLSDGDNILDNIKVKIKKMTK